MESRRANGTLGTAPVGVRTPGCAVARTGSRVVDYGDLDPRTNSRVSTRLPSGNAFSARSVGANMPAVEVSSYEPYVHLVTGERALVQVRVDPATQRRVLVAPLPDVYVPQHVVEQLHQAQQQLNESSNGCVASFLRCIRVDGGDTVTNDAPMGAPVDAVRPDAAPPVVRQLQFDENDGEESGLQLQPKLRLASKTLENLFTQLDLVSIDDFLIDFKAAIGNVDKHAYILLDAADWRPMLEGSPVWAVEANRRIAEALNATLDSKAPNVKRLKTILREAEAGESPGILSSGMDMIAEVKALVHGRSAGEVKSDMKEAMSISFKLGAPINENRLIADEIKKHYAIKSPGERAVENGIFHEMLGKVPSSNDSLLNIQMKMYVNDLHKAEMASPPEPPPWTLTKLIDNIAIDLSTAVAKEVSAIEDHKKSSSKVLTPDYKCANCGEEGAHFSYDCKENVCEECNFNFCPGGRDMLCAMLCVEKPSKRGDQIVNYFGRPLRVTAPKLIEKLDRAWEHHHKKN
jgi:hypothetical protein